MVQQGQLYVIIIHLYSAALILQGTLPPVYGASTGGHLAIVELLVSRGARIDQPCDVRLIIILCACYIHHSYGSTIAGVVYAFIYVVIHTSTCSLAHNTWHVHNYCSQLQ